MKVLHIINSLATGGAEKLVLDTVPRYNAKGVETDVLVFKDDSYTFYAALQELECCKIFNLDNNSLYNPVSIFKMIRILKNYDIAHVHLFPAQYFVVFAKLLSFSKIKLIFTEHNTSNRRLENKLYKIVDRWSYKSYYKVIAISEKIKEVLTEHIGGKSKKITLIENGVAIDAIRRAVPLGKADINTNISQEDVLIIQVAGFRIQKDQECLIKAMALLPLNVKLILVGEGITMSKCQDRVSELNLQNRVYFLGVRTDIPNLLKTADIVVLSSHFEGMSLSSIEGMASGKPFVASDVPGLKEIVDGYGVLFRKSDEQHLANVISELLVDENYYNNVAHAGEEHAKNFDIEVMVNKHLELYKETYNA